MHRLKTLADELSRFADAAAIVWSTYKNVGPSKVESSLHDSVEDAARVVLELLNDDEIRGMSLEHEMSTEEMASMVEVVRDFSHRCACTPMGLCFVTGEAGLIPRKDQHEAFDKALESLNRWADECRAR